MNKCEKVKETIKQKDNIVDNNEYVEAIFDNFKGLQAQARKRVREGHFDTTEFADLTRIEYVINQLEDLDDAGHLNEDDLLKLDRYLFYKYKATKNKRDALNNNK